MARLAVLEPDARLAARLGAALADHHELIECHDLEELWNVVMNRPVDGCVLDIYHPTHPVSLLDLQRLRRRMPPLAIIVYADFEDRELDLFELGRLKIDGAILTGATDHASETRRSVSGALAAASALGVVAALDGQLHPLAMECLRWSIEHAEESPSVEQLADGLALTPAILARELHDRRLPSPARLLLWGRLFRAARLLANPVRSVEDTAFRLGYSSAPALGRALRRETGFAPNALRRRGTIACVLDGFVRRELRSLERERRERA
ncbi:MAG: AraC family transcriptional regulator [Gemmatimonadetes bacterium]|nr:AraC family transcriptional regulator [Gemmatimonadota bacterium]